MLGFGKRQVSYINKNSCDGNIPPSLYGEKKLQNSGLLYFATRFHFKLHPKSYKILAMPDIQFWIPKSGNCRCPSIAAS